MLNPKSMSEAYLFVKNTENPAKEIGIIKKQVQDYEKPFENWSDSIKKSLSTNIERTTLVSSNLPVYKIKNCMGTREGIYGVNGKLYFESTMFANSKSSNHDDEISSNNTVNGSSSTRAGDVLTR